MISAPSVILCLACFSNSQGASADAQVIADKLSTQRIEESLPTQPVTAEILARQDSATSDSIIRAFEKVPKFEEAAAELTAQVIARDEADEEELLKGIQLAIDKGVLPEGPEELLVVTILAEHKSAKDIAQVILERLGDAPRKGCVMTLQGLSGTGKGTTLAVLRTMIPNAQTWSNGNIFRALTLLATTYAKQNNIGLEEALTKENLERFISMIHFVERGADFDVKIDGLGFNLWVSEVAQTVLQSQVVRTNVPVVAGATQGEVINFVQGALRRLVAAGKNVLIEGREETLNYIDTPYRFELVLRNKEVIGQRRAAQIMGGHAIEKMQEWHRWWSGGGIGTDDDVKAALTEALDDLLEAASTTEAPANQVIWPDWTLGQASWAKLGGWFPLRQPIGNSYVYGHNMYVADFAVATAGLGGPTHGRNSWNPGMAGSLIHSSHGRMPEIRLSGEIPLEWLIVLAAVLPIGLVAGMTITFAVIRRRRGASAVDEPLLSADNA